MIASLLDSTMAASQERSSPSPALRGGAARLAPDVRPWETRLPLFMPNSDLHTKDALQVPFS